MPSSLPISETFVSIQGEGLLTGMPSLFIRVAGCNLRCAWCDTPYASWSPESGTKTIDELVEWARRVAEESGVRHAVLTGGEPMMFPQICELSFRLAQARERGGAGMHITIETAGTIIPQTADPSMPLTCHLMSISPKLANSTPRDDPRDPGNVWSLRHEQRRTNLPVLQTLLDHYPAPSRQLKFVVSSTADVDEIESLLAKLKGWTPGDVLLMPEGVTLPSADRKKLVIDACLRRGYRYCTRLHIELFGNTRGT